MNKDQLLDILLWEPNPGTFLWKCEDAPKQFLALKDVKQSPIHHPEQENHFRLVIDNMAIITGQLCTFHDISLMLAALCHDLGKATCTRWHETKQKWVSYGHEMESERLSIELLTELELKEYINVVSKLCRWHMTHTNKSFTNKSVKKLINNLYPTTIDDLILLMRSDCMSRPPLSPDLPEPIINELIPIYKSII